MRYSMSHISDSGLFKLGLRKNIIPYQCTLLYSKSSGYYTVYESKILKIDLIESPSESEGGLYFKGEGGEYQFYYNAININTIEIVSELPLDVIKLEDREEITIIEPEPEVKRYVQSFLANTFMTLLGLLYILIIGGIILILILLLIGIFKVIIHG